MVHTLDFVAGVVKSRRLRADNGRIRRERPAVRGEKLQRRMEKIFAELFGLLQNRDQRLQTFSFVVSHHLRTHTSTLQQLLTFLPAADQPAELAQVHQHLHQVTDRLETTLQDLSEVLSLHHKYHLVLESLNLSQRVAEVWQQLVVGDKPFTATLHNAVPTSLELQYHAPFLNNILENALTHAVQAPKAGRILEVWVDAWIERGKVVLQVVDNGQGLDLSQQRAGAFGFYQTFHRPQRKNGLGLFMIKQQVELMGGSVNLESQPGVGSTLKITLL